MPNLPRSTGPHNDGTWPISRRALAFGVAVALRSVHAADSGVQFVFGTYGMKSLSAPEALSAVAKAGYDGVELCVMAGFVTDAAAMSRTAISEVRKMLGDHQLSVPAVLDSLPLLGTGQPNEANLERIRRIAEVAHGLALDQPPVLDTVLGGKPADWPSQRPRLVEALQGWARVAEATGITVAIKPHADHAVNSPARAIDLLREVASRRVRLVYDYSHFRVEGFGLEDSLRQLFPYTALISLKDSAGKSGSHQYLLPGDGDTDYSQYFQLLAQLGYKGAIGVEVSSMLHLKPDYDPVRTVDLCYQRLAPLLRAAGLARRSNARSTR